MNLFNILYDLEVNEDLHISRLLILLKSFSGRSLKPFRGITKLVKLDFLLRYPLYLEKAINSLELNGDSINILDHEKNSVESRMIRFKYGPWDPRYREFLNIMAAKNLINVYLRKNTIIIKLTPEGMKIATELSTIDNFEDILNRSRILKKHFDIGATRLKDFIYKTFPEIIEMSYGEVI